jgi:hypothetical protein
MHRAKVDLETKAFNAKYSILVISHGEKSLEQYHIGRNIEMNSYLIKAAKNEEKRTI